MLYFFPVGHENQTVQRWPWVTIGLIALNVATFLVSLPIVRREDAEIDRRAEAVARYAEAHPYLRLPKELRDTERPRRPPADLPAEQLATQQASLDRLYSEYRESLSGSLTGRYGFVPARPRPQTFLTSMFLHGSWWHLIDNMLILWVVGPALEDRWGRAVLLALYVLSDLAGNLADMAAQPRRETPSIGASGAISGLMAAFLLRMATTRIRFFYWVFLFFKGYFYVRAFILFPFLVLLDLAGALSGGSLGVAVWAHLGGFFLGLLAALFIRATGLETKVLAPRIEKKTTWTPSDRLAGALQKLDRGDPQGAARALQGLLRAKPDDMDARMALVAAYAAQGDRAAAGRESAKIVAQQIKARNLDAALAAFREHGFAYPDVPLGLRDQLALAAHCEQVREFPEAADLYQSALATWPDDPLAPNALLAFGRLKLDVFRRPEDAVGLLEQARNHPAATAEIQRAAAEALEAARKTLRPRWQGRDASPPRLEPSPPPEPVSTEPAAPAPLKPSPARLVAVPVRAVGIDARGISLEDRHGRSGRLEWRGVKAVSVGKVAGMAAGDAAAESLLLDLVLTARTTPAGAEFRCARIAVQDIALPQLQNEPSPTRAFQRLVATILKATGAVAYPGRDVCVTLKDLPVAPHLGAYEADLLARLASQDAVSSLVLPE